MSSGGLHGPEADGNTILQNVGKKTLTDTVSRLRNPAPSLLSLFRVLAVPGTNLGPGDLPLCRKSTTVFVSCSRFINVNRLKLLHSSPFLNRLS